MGSSSSKKEQTQPSIPKTININLHIDGLQELLSTKNSSTHFEGNNSFTIFEGDPPPLAGQNQKQMNSYKNQSQNIQEQPKNENVNNSLYYSISQKVNIDNNKTDAYLSKKNENNTKFGNEINPYIKEDENLYSKKETSKGSKYKEEINPNIGKFNPEYYNFFTKTGDKDDKNENSPGENKDNNVHDSKSHPLDISKNENELSQSILLASLQNLNFTDSNDLLKIKEMAVQKFNEGYFPLFIKMNHKYTFYYLKKENTLESLLIAHLNNCKISYNGKKYSFYNKGKKLNPNIPVIDIEDLPILSPIEIKLIE